MDVYGPLKLSRANKRDLANLWQIIFFRVQNHEIHPSNGRLGNRAANCSEDFKQFPKFYGKTNSLFYYLWFVIITTVW